ncbi:MAG: Uma2 family endonuclease [Gammaproteobacteria bacterium]|nr:Uma2 family endonuclease [Gammaproteobacteria bacterium]
MNLQPLIRLTPEQYLYRERQSGVKSEYFDGEIFARAGASREHHQIAANLVRVLGTQLLERPCNVYSSDMKVHIDKARKYTYPDVVVACQPEQFEDAQRDVLLNPVVIIEILSDSTEADDRGHKFLHDQLLDVCADFSECRPHRKILPPGRQPVDVFQNTRTGMMLWKFMH